MEIRTGRRISKIKGRTHKMCLYGASSSDNAADALARATAVEFDRKILVLCRGGLRGSGEDQRVNDGEEGVDRREKVHFDWVDLVCNEEALES